MANFYKVQYRSYSEGYSQTYSETFNTYEEARKFIDDEADCMGVARTWSSKKGTVCSIGENTSFKILKMEIA